MNYQKCNYAGLKPSRATFCTRLPFTLKKSNTELKLGLFSGLDLKKESRSKLGWT